MMERTTHSTTLGELHERPLPAPKQTLSGIHRAFVSDSGCSIFVSQEPVMSAPGGMWVPESMLLRWHISIAHKERYPTWDEIAEARYLLAPDEITMVMLLPPKGEYVNKHNHCFHLHEVDL